MSDPPTERRPSDHSADDQSAGDEAAGPLRGLVHRPATAPVFDLVQRPVDGPLGGFVDGLWTVDWDRGDAPPVTSEVLPFPSVHITLEWGTDGVRHGVDLPATLVHGIATRLFRTHLANAGSVVGARFRPGGFAALFGVSVRELSDNVFLARDLLSDRVVDPLDAALATEDIEGCATTLVSLLGALVSAAAPDETFAWVDALVGTMRDDPGLVRVDQLPDRCGWSLRTIQRAFHRYVGAGPKWVLTRFRLQEAALALEQDPTIDLTDLALRLGYYDHSHFTNDFRAIFGVTPSDYAAAAPAG